MPVCALRRDMDNRLLRRSLVDIYSVHSNTSQGLELRWLSDGVYRYEQS